MAKLCESAIEAMAIEELQTLGYTYIAGVDLAPDAPNPERGSYSDFLNKRLFNSQIGKTVAND
jgi:type I restriction enzyme R subunit